MGHSRGARRFAGSRSTRCARCSTSSRTIVTPPPADAFITAQVFLRLLRLSSKHGRGTLGRISELFPVDA
jgi:hypothetical protein